MPFATEKFIALRPFAYHLTERSNLPSILEEGSLRSAAHWIEAAGREDLEASQRTECRRVVARGREIHLRDQKPLFEKNIDLRAGWTYADLVRHLNRHVFFWPGGASSVDEYCRRYHRCYSPGDIVILRLETAALFAANAPRQPLFCPFNSGAPGGRRGPVPRGPDLFLPAGEFARTAAAAKELVFEDFARLPGRLEVASDLEGPWRAARLKSLRPAGEIG
ncbi:MAG: hypothetical protein AAF725_21150 [Acidobacteriota bacterium]